MSKPTSEELERLFQACCKPGRTNKLPAWWEHGQKVITRFDGVLTLNIAPDVEFWLTNESGKEVYVFSADILGPANDSTKGGAA